MEHILMIDGSKTDWEGYARRSKKDLERNVAFMRAFRTEAV
jgi:alkaline phosphatase